MEANEKKLDHNPTVDEPVIPFETLKNFVNRKHLAYEMTPKSPNEVNYIELSRTIPINRALKQAFKQTQIKKNHCILINYAKIVVKMAALIHEVLNDKLFFYLQLNFQSRQQYNVQPKSATQKMC